MPSQPAADSGSGPGSPATISRVQLPGSVVFFGTPGFAVPTLEALCRADCRPLLVVTQPARGAGRGRRLVASAVARRAAQLGLDVEEVESVRDKGFLRRLGTMEPWVGVVVAFGQIFPRQLLEIPVVGCVNLHASLLPRYRGAAPVQAALAAGERVTGVTTMRMTAGLDEGPILLQRRLEIGDRETTPELSDRLATLGAVLVLETLGRMATGAVEPREQDDAEASYAPRLTREDGRLDWNLTARQIFDRWRAYTPWPGLTAVLAGAPLKILECHVAASAVGSADPGAIVAAGRFLDVACGGETVLRLERLQRPGRRPVEAQDLVNGERLEVGDRFETRS